VRTVDPSFHARNDATSKTYRYWLDRSSCGDPFVSRYALHVPSLGDRDALEAALGKIPGRRDWSGFAGSASEVADSVRHVHEAKYEELGPALAAFTFTADGFLNHMVRNLVGTLLDVARARFRPDRIDEVLASRDRTRAGPTAPARGLCLERVTY
jgi:tRNA pseudouridine38-40 synthase